MGTWPPSVMRRFGGLLNSTGSNWQRHTANLSASLSRQLKCNCRVTPIGMHGQSACLTLRDTIELSIGFQAALGTKILDGGWIGCDKAEDGRGIHDLQRCLRWTISWQVFSVIHVSDYCVFRFFFLAEMAAASYKFTSILETCDASHVHCRCNRILPLRRSCPVPD